MPYMDLMFKVNRTMVGTTSITLLDVYKFKLKVTEYYKMHGQNILQNLL